ncbi:hypothetical protein EDD80_103333 [Anseongella ginsenosidimutans]|uniref:Uncharacterized protein n=1 Tax=Anseongella ginsenosidimutans TaxID=496056 RepID=A0A4R3KT86_9SPHI|nr:hypothetical protein [Anseongella ginsenosidimutans]QEC53561.1 hypothetical protein FRZ59_15280 [Anseongella ginsenosidimutans]TCS88468.1 hypothetical protein EDD80_103333 [Anseongella ginsenosidimutans]
MKYLVLAFFTICSTIELSAQKPDPEALLREGKKLYRLEKAAWYATDHFLMNFQDKRDSVGGYLSYQGVDGLIYSIFFNRDLNKILVRYQFGKDPAPIPEMVNTEMGLPIGDEGDLIVIRQKAVDMLTSNKDSFFTFYENTSFNPIPLIEGDQRKVYVLTASKKQGSIFIGNDYLLEYNANNELKSKRKLHNSLIEIPFQTSDEQEALGTMHTHILSNHMEPTDICTLLLYKDYVNWSQHYTIHKDYISILDLKKENLVIIAKKAFDKIQNSKRLSQPGNH